MPAVIISDLLLTGIISGGLHLDRTAAFQFLISRPIVASVITGLALSEPAVGLGAGLVLELLWLGIHPLGTSVPPDDTVVAIVVPAGVILAGRSVEAIVLDEPTAVLALAILLALPLALLGKWIDIGLRKLNGRFLKAAREGAKDGDTKKVGRQIVKSIFAIFFAFTIFTVVGTYLLTIIIFVLYPKLGVNVLSALKLVYFTIPFFGVVGILDNLRDKKIFKFVAAFGATYLILILIGGVI